MQCPKCGNEVSQDEAFCGQCGVPIIPPSHPTEMVPAPRSGLLNSYNNSANMPVPPPTQAYKSGMLPPPNPYNPTNVNRPGVYGGNVTPPNVNQQPPNHTMSFYQDATEAISAVPPGTPANPNQGYPPAYPQQGFVGTPMQPGYPNVGNAGQYNSQVQQPFPPGNYTQHGFPQTPQFPTGQGYSYSPQPQPQPQITPVPQKRGSAALVIASVCLVIALIAVVAFGALYLTRSHSPQQASVTPTPAATTAPSPTPTSAPSPTPTVTDTPTPAPTPTLTPTPPADANFSWCGTSCTTNGFTVEFPNGWNQEQTADKTGIEFLDPQPTDVFAAFKTPGSTTSTASALVANDLQANFANQQGYTPPATTQTTTIGGENWTYQIAHYQSNNQQERIEVFATVHQGKAYIIELQAPESQFDTTYNTSYFATMIGRFQFLPGAA